MAGTAAGAGAAAGGAAGGAGVDADAAGAGVAGAADEEEAAAFGSALGCYFVSGPWHIMVGGNGIYLVHDAYDKALLLDLVRLDGVLILQNLACCLISMAVALCPAA